MGRRSDVVPRKKKMQDRKREQEDSK